MREVFAWRYIDDIAKKKPSDGEEAAQRQQTVGVERRGNYAIRRLLRRPVASSFQHTLSNNHHARNHAHTLTHNSHKVRATHQ